VRKAAFAAAAAGLALAACATDRSAAEARIYRCVLERAEADGTLSLSIQVDQDGRRLYHFFGWTLRSPRDGAQVGIDWINVGAPTPAQGMQVTFGLRRTWRTRFARVVLLRGEDGLQSRTIMGPTYGRDYPTASLTVTLAHLREFLTEAPHLTVAAVGANGRLLTRHRIEKAVFERAASAMTAAQPEVEAMAADYRRRCVLGPPDRVILT